MSALTRETTLFDVHHAAVWPLIGDVRGAASASYGASVSVPGIQQVGFQPNFVGGEVKGDSQVQARRSKIDRIAFTCTESHFSLDVAAVIFGLAVQDITTEVAGATDGSYVDLDGDQRLPYFLFSFVIDETDPGVGSVLNVAWKCMLTGGALMGGQTDQFHSPGLDFEAIPLLSTGRLWRPYVLGDVVNIGSAVNSILAAQ